MPQKLILILQNSFLMPQKLILVPQNSFVMPQNLVLDSKLKPRGKVNYFWNFITLKLELFYHPKSRWSHVKNQRKNLKTKPKPEQDP
jgi:hypothetical protein